MKWRRGQSGNPNGRPKRDAELAALARQHTAAALAALAEIAQHGKQEAARVSAATALLDRAWGRPRQALEHAGVDGEAIRFEGDLAQLSDAELHAFAMGLRHVPN